MDMDFCHTVYLEEKNDRRKTIDENDKSLVSGKINNLLKTMSNLLESTA